MYPVPSQNQPMVGFQPPYANNGAPAYPQPQPGYPQPAPAYPQQHGAYPQPQQPAGYPQPPMYQQPPQYQQPPMYQAGAAPAPTYAGQQHMYNNSAYSAPMPAPYPAQPAMRPAQPQPGYPMPQQPGAYPAQPAPGYPAPGAGAGAPSAQVTQIAENINRAIRGVGTNDKLLIETITRVPPQFWPAVRANYAQRFGRSVDEDIRHDTSGNYGRLALLLVLPRPELIAQLVHDAVRGLGSDWEMLSLCLGSVTNADLIAARQAYDMRYHKGLDSDVTSEMAVSGDFGRFIKAILAGLPPPTAPNPAQVETDVEDLQRACKGMGTDEAALIRLFTIRSRPHLGAVFDRYQQKYGKDIVKLMKSELSGKMRYLTLVYVSSCLTPDCCGGYARAIRSACKGMGTNESLLNGATALAAPFWQAMPSAYSRVFAKRSLARDIKGDTSFNYEKLLLRALGC